MSRLPASPGAPPALRAAYAFLQACFAFEDLGAHPRCMGVGAPARERLALSLFAFAGAALAAQVGG